MVSNSKYAVNNVIPSSNKIPVSSNALPAGFFIPAPDFGHLVPDGGFSGRRKDAKRAV